MDSEYSTSFGVVNSSDHSDKRLGLLESQRTPKGSLDARILDNSRLLSFLLHTMLEYTKSKDKSNLMGTRELMAYGYSNSNKTTVDRITETTLNTTLISVPTNKKYYIEH